MSKRKVEGAEVGGWHQTVCLVIRQLSQPLFFASTSALRTYTTEHNSKMLLCELKSPLDKSEHSFLLID